MTDLSRSTAHRIISPAVAALCLAALRLGLQLEPNPALKLSTEVPPGPVDLPVKSNRI